MPCYYFPFELLSQLEVLRRDLEDIYDKFRTILDFLLEFLVALLLLLGIREIFLIILERGTARPAGRHNVIHVEVLVCLDVQVRQHPARLKVATEIDCGAAAILVLGYNNFHSVTGQEIDELETQFGIDEVGSAPHEETDSHLGFLAVLGFVDRLDLVSQECL
ncbi:MAG: hypothetical protein CVU72_06615 [Deltaproteobacteria bacterium HGW-Deltaproteobacteria-7]|nr:MAG: hypothetical protein CVU72_06615 [Deltaproteobacteria bacterium HGW-Deltaproteobacteria-7]